MNFRQLIRDYFTFSRNERKGLTILLILIFLLGVANKVIFYFETPGKIDAALLDSARRELGLHNDSVNLQAQGNGLSVFSAGITGADSPDKYDPKPSGTASPVSELFTFDPNKATDSDFARLGFSEKQIASIRKYMKNGGSFRSPDDFFRLRIIGEDQKRNLDGYVFIGEKEASPPKRISVSTELRIDLNSADSIVLKRLPGIGDKLSKRILKYRDLLGGFYSAKQLKEVYGLDEQVIAQIEDMLIIDRSKIRKLDLNFADANELSRHPYLKKRLALQIIKFRARNGSISDLVVLRDSMILKTDEYDRLKPYF